MKLEIFFKFLNISYIFWAKIEAKIPDAKTLVISLVCLCTTHPCMTLCILMNYIFMCSNYNITYKLNLPIMYEIRRIDYRELCNFLSAESNFLCRMNLKVQ